MTRGVASSNQMYDVQSVLEELTKEDREGRFALALSTPEHVTCVG
jgi:hypothetical protein